MMESKKKKGGTTLRAKLDDFFNPRSAADQQLEDPVEDLYGHKLFKADKKKTDA
jgi:hypothetical protein